MTAKEKLTEIKNKIAAHTDDISFVMMTATAIYALALAESYRRKLNETRTMTTVVFDNGMLDALTRGDSILFTRFGTDLYSKIMETPIAK